MKITPVICKNCGAPMDFINIHSRLKCKYCGTSYIVENVRECINNSTDSPIDVRLLITDNSIVDLQILNDDYALNPTRIAPFLKRAKYIIAGIARFTGTKQELEYCCRNTGRISFRSWSRDGKTNWFGKRYFPLMDDSKAGIAKVEIENNVERFYNEIGFAGFDADKITEETNGSVSPVRGKDLFTVIHGENFYKDYDEIYHIFGHYTGNPNSSIPVDFISIMNRIKSREEFNTMTDLLESKIAYNFRAAEEKAIENPVMETITINLNKIDFSSSLSNLESIVFHSYGMDDLEQGMLLCAFSSCLIGELINRTKENSQPLLSIKKMHLYDRCVQFVLIHRKQYKKVYNKWV